MKKTKIYLIALLIALSVQAHAQNNYLFSASSKPYVPVTRGTSPYLTTNFSGWEAADEGYAGKTILNSKIEKLSVGKHSFTIEKKAWSGINFLNLKINDKHFVLKLVFD